MDGINGKDQEEKEREKIIKQSVRENGLESFGIKC